MIGTLTPVGVSAVRLEPKDLKVVVAVPDFAVSTTAARRALPESVSHRDAAFNVGRSGLLLGALATGEYDLLRVAMQDRLHQPYRAHLIPGLEDVIEAALAHGAYGACLSGSGPTVLAFAPEERATYYSLGDEDDLRGAGRRGEILGARRRPGGSPRRAAGRGLHPGTMPVL